MVLEIPSNEASCQNKIKKIPLILIPRDMEYLKSNWKRIQNSYYEEIQQLQENSKWQYKDFNNKIIKQKEYFTKDIEILKKNNQTNSRAEEVNKWGEKCIKKHSK